MKCKACGQELSPEARICPICKTEQGMNLEKTEMTHEQIEMIHEETNSCPSKRGYPYSPRSRVVAGLLQIFLGGFGLGRFYLGYNKMALGQLFTFPIFFIGGIWAFIDGVLILCGQVTEDANGIPLK